MQESSSDIQNVASRNNDLNKLGKLQGIIKSDYDVSDHALNQYQHNQHEYSLEDKEQDKDRLTSMYETGYNVEPVRSGVASKRHQPSRLVIDRPFSRKSRGYRQDGSFESDSFPTQELEYQTPLVSVGSAESPETSEEDLQYTDTKYVCINKKCSKVSKAH